MNDETIIISYLILVVAGVIAIPFVYPWKPTKHTRRERADLKPHGFPVVKLEPGAMQRTPPRPNRANHEQDSDQ
jgi:hypothetical protein